MQMAVWNSAWNAARRKGSGINFHARANIGTRVGSEIDGVLILGWGCLVGLVMCMEDDLCE